MKKYVCDPCGYIYDPEAGDPDSGIAPGTAFEDLPEDWVCPICGVGKDMFSPVEAPVFWMAMRKLAGTALRKLPLETPDQLKYNNTYENFAAGTADTTKGG